MRIRKQAGSMEPVKNDEREQESRGQAIRRRRLALGIRSVKRFSDEIDVDRGTLTKLEADDPSVQEQTYERVEVALDHLEERLGMDLPDPITTTIELPDGTKVTFRTGADADAAARAADRFLRLRTSTSTSEPNGD